MTAVFLTLATLWLLDGLRLRGRVRRLAVVYATDGPDPADYALLAAPGVTLTGAGLHAVAADARQRGLDLVDLIPARAPAWRLLPAIAKADPAIRDHVFKSFPSAGYALVVSRSLLARSGRDWAPTSARMVQQTALRLRHYAGRRVDWVVTPALSVPRAGAPGDDAASRLELVAPHESPVAGIGLALTASLYLLGLMAPFLDPVGGSALLVAMHTQPLISFVGTPVRPGDLGRVTLLRALLEVVVVARLALAWRPGREPDEITARRAVYAGAGPTFEARRDHCPLCDGRDLDRYLESHDTVQGKPGRFRLDRCRGCGHIFQNPRLSVDGLSYYYRDAYDGLSQDFADVLFGMAEPSYRGRVEAVRDLGSPRRWLDVGAGHGHFCAVAREQLPDVRFEGLDLSESIDDAVRRGWIDRAHRGLFPELGPVLRSADEPFDVVSMHHYLEHTLDPIAELRAANRVLPDGGLLLIEVPDPDYRLSRVLGRLWAPWLQPQHLHFVSAANLERALRAHGFEPVRWHRGEAHMSRDLLGAVLLLMKWIAPTPRAPWRPAPGVGRFLWHNLACLGLAPLLAAGWLADAVLGRLRDRPGWSNTYRVVARKVAEIEAAETPAAA